MSLYPLTKRQGELVRAVDRLTVGGVAPSYDELRTVLRLASTSTVHWLINQAIGRGWLTHLSGHPRSIRLTDAAREELHNG